MSGDKTVSGGCLCGSIRFEAQPDAPEMGVCHCSMCRQWTGGVFMMVACGDTVKIKDDSDLGIYQSSKWGQRCFCKKCGSSLFWKTTEGNFHGVAVSALDNPSPYEFKRQIFIDEKPDNYSFANETHNMTGAQVFEMFASSDGGNDNG